MVEVGVVMGVVWGGDGVEGGGVAKGRVGVGAKVAVVGVRVTEVVIAKKS